MALFLVVTSVRADEPSLFDLTIAPLLQQRCVTCHNATKKRGGLDLTTRDKLLKGGNTGPAILAGDAGKSLLIDMVSGLDAKMPKRGDKLTAQEIDALRRWIDGGATWTKGVTLVEQKTTPRIDADWWSLKAIVRPKVPEVKNKARVRTPIDAFILATLEAKGLTPAPAADKTTLIRRLTYDLHGLPPTPEEIDAFLKDDAPDAYEKLVDRLLASPRYGERWGRYWLDIVHYGDTHGYDKDKRRDHAWPYRDYVIRAFNSDKPYTRFLKEQLAGDVLYKDDADGIMATGFIAAGPWDFVSHVELREGTVEKEKTRLLDRDDMVSNTMATFASPTVHCARCHDHKFDPIPQKDYYRLQAVFAGVERGDRPYPNPQSATQRTNLLVDKELLQKRHDALLARRPETTGPELEKLDAEIRKTKEQLAALDKRLSLLAQADQVYAVVPRAPRPIHRLNRGDVEQQRDLVSAGALSCVSGLDANFPKSDDEGKRRAALANWLADAKNPLTWRSIVNRVWQDHFGRGLVDTPSDFGRNGSRPTHPELLDWLAVEFRDNGSSFKKLHRLILTSAVYRQASKHDAANAKIDADNRYLWRMNRARLDAESIRDSVLSISGKLDLTMGGPGFELFRFKDDHSPVYDHTALEKIHDPATYRRTVYRFTVRSVPNPFLESLDCADPNINTPVRNTTLTALQALALLNDPFMVRQAEHFAERLKKTSDNPDKQIETAYRLAFGRVPKAEERMALAAYVKKHGLANMCRLLFNANEFVFVD
jgi:hypothetical protein